jgi:DNA-binding XRE family transcriptional regulator
MSSDTHALCLRKNRTDNRALQNLEKSNPGFPHYLLTLPIPKEIFNENYPVNPATFGDRLRKARIDAGLNIRELAAWIGVTEDTVINWEIRGMRPLRRKVREKVREFTGYP